MLITVLVMAVVVSVEPFRIGMTVLMLNRPRPIRQLLAFLSGGFAMGMAVGLAVLFGFRRALVGSTYFTVSTVQMLIGGLALTVAAVLVGQDVTGWLSRRPAKLVEQADRLLDGRSLWVAAVVGLGIALPSVDYLAVLAVILASGSAALTQLSALLLFNVVAFGFVEVPLVAYVLAPRTTRAWMTALHSWIRSRHRIQVAALLATVGGALLAVGWVGR